MARTPKHTPQQQAQASALHDSLFEAMAAGDGLPMDLVTDAVLLVAASVLLNAGASPAAAAAALQAAMLDVGDPNEDPLPPMASWALAPAAQA